MNLFGSELRKLRKDAELSVRGLATELGKSPGYISRVEARGETPSTEFVAELAEFFDADIELLLQLVKRDQLAKAEEQINEKHASTIQLFRKGKTK